MNLPKPGDYDDLTIDIGKLETDAYPVKMILRGGPEHSGKLRAEAIRTVESTKARKQGEVLFQQFLGDEDIRDAWHQIHGTYGHLRLRLKLDERAPELFTLPWEAASVDRVPLAASGTTPLSRYLEATKQHGQVVDERPLRILVVIANPSDLEEYDLKPLDTPVERSALEKATAEAVDENRLEVKFLDSRVTLVQLEDELSHYRPHVLHIVAHGKFNPPPHGSVLYLENDEQQVGTVNEDQLTDMFSRLKKMPRLVYLSSCDTAKTSSENALHGFAPGLVKAGVPAVLAMKGQMPIKSARPFAATLYRQLLDHGMVDLAANEARSRLLSAELPGATLPTLFMRLHDGLLFEPLAVEREPTNGRATPDGEADSALNGTSPMKTAPDNWLSLLIHTGMKLMGRLFNESRRERIFHLIVATLFAGAMALMMFISMWIFPNDARNIAISQLVIILASFMLLRLQADNALMRFAFSLALFIVITTTPVLIHVQAYLGLIEETTPNFKTMLGGYPFKETFIHGIMRGLINTSWAFPFFLYFTFWPELKKKSAEAPKTALTQALLMGLILHLIAVVAMAGWWNVIPHRIKASIAGASDNVRMAIESSQTFFLVAALACPALGFLGLLLLWAIKKWARPRDNEVLLAVVIALFLVQTSYHVKKINSRELDQRYPASHLNAVGYKSWETGKIVFFKNSYLDISQTKLGQVRIYASCENPSSGKFDISAMSTSDFQNQFKKFGQLKELEPKDLFCQK